MELTKIHRLSVVALSSIVFTASALAQDLPVRMNIDSYGWKDNYYGNVWDGPVGRSHDAIIGFTNYTGTAYRVEDWEFILLRRESYNSAFQNLDIKLKLTVPTGTSSVINGRSRTTLNLTYNYEALTATGPAYGRFTGIFRLKHEGVTYISREVSHNIVQNPVPEPATALLVMPAVAWIIRKRNSTQRKGTAV